MITQQQRKELTLAAVDCEHQINADCIRLWRDPTKEGTALAQLMDRVVAAIEQGAQPGADVVMVPRKPNAVQVAAGNRVTWPFPCEQVYRVMIDAFAAAPQPQQEQSK